MLKEILNKKNIEKAYFEVVSKFDETSKSNRYTGIDGLTLNDFNFNSRALLKEVRDEMLNLKPIAPAIEVKIPKKNGGERKIYIFTIKDRIKAQAIYQVLEPYFENIYSPFLFSYRSSHPSYYAAKSIAKRYVKNYGKDYIFQADISEYTENINKKYLKNKLKKTGLSKEILNLLSLFIDNTVLINNKIVSPKKGVIQGVPVITFFANIYLNDIDKYIGKKVALYRRVGDDFILFDKNQKKVKEMQKYMISETRKLNLAIQKAKTKIIKSNEEFTFLGYTFKNKIISINKSSVNKFSIALKAKLKYYRIPQTEKVKRFEKLLYQGPDSVHHKFVQFISSYKQANNKNQIRGIDDQYLKFITKYFFKNFSKRNKRLAQEIIRNFKIPLISSYFLDFHNGKKTIAELSLSKKS